MLTLIAAIQQTPPDHKGVYDLDRDELTETAEAYDAALTRIKDRVPEGWRIAHVRTAADPRTD